MAVYGIDTHALWWYLEESPRLSKEAKAAMENPTSRLLISVVVLAELKWAYLKGKFSLDTSLLSDLLKQIRTVTLCPLTPEIVHAMPASLEMHDGLICATCLDWTLKSGQPVTLITQDKQITASRIVPVLW